MGQYYRIHFCPKFTGEVSIFKGSALKLLEMAYWKDIFCDDIASLIVNEPTYITWCGDYADEDECRRCGFHYSTVWKSPQEPSQVTPKPDFDIEKQAALINHTRREYLDLKKYKAKGEDYAEENRSLAVSQIALGHPLPLLTALGNGRGGGDYCAGMLNYHHVGRWAGDLISIGEIPKGYKEFDTLFVVKFFNSGFAKRSDEYMKKVLKLDDDVMDLRRKESDTHKQGVLCYAMDLVNTLIEHPVERMAPSDIWTNAESFEKTLLLGAKDWSEYSKDGHSLTHLDDIADRLEPQVEELCFDKQTEALEEAVSLLKNLAFNNSFTKGVIMTYKPNPIKTDDVVLPESVLELGEMIAENTHEVWAKGREDDGWTYGEERNDAEKKHPCMIPYAKLSDEEKEYDRRTSMETLKLIYKLGYKIVKND